MKILVAVYVLVLCQSHGSDKTQLVKSLTANIQNLGDTLYEMVMSVPIGQGSKFLQNIRLFNRYLKEMVELSNADKNSTKSALDALITSGIPKYLDTPFTHHDRLKILDNFNWTLDDLDKLYADRVTSYTYWTDLLLIKNDNYQYDGYVIPGTLSGEELTQIFRLINEGVADEVTTERIYWYKPYTDDPEVIAHNATLRKQVMEKIIPLGRSLQMTLEKLPKGAGEKFMKDLDVFIDLYKQFLNLVNDDKANSKPDVDYLHDRSYPHLADTDFSEEDMKNSFNWSSAEVEEFYKKRSEANGYYIDLQLCHHWYH